MDTCCVHGGCISASLVSPTEAPPPPSASLCPCRCGCCQRALLTPQGSGSERKAWQLGRGRGFAAKLGVRRVWQLLCSGSSAGAGAVFGCSSPAVPAPGEGGKDFCRRRRSAAAMLPTRLRNSSVDDWWNKASLSTDPEQDGGVGVVVGRLRPNLPPHRAPHRRGGPSLGLLGWARGGSGCPNPTGVGLCRGASCGGTELSSAACRGAGTAAVGTVLPDINCGCIVSWVYITLRFIISIKILWLYFNPLFNCTELSLARACLCIAAWKMESIFQTGTMNMSTKEVL